MPDPREFRLPDPDEVPLVEEDDPQDFRLREGARLPLEDAEPDREDQDRADSGPIPLADPDRDEADAPEPPRTAPKPPARPAVPPLTPGKPLPRLVRFTDPDDLPAEGPEKSRKRKGRDRTDEPAPTERRRDRSGSKAAPIDRGDEAPRSLRERKPVETTRPRARRDDGDEPRRDRVLLEETPEIDTVETRKAIRIVVGLVAVVGLLGVILTQSGLFGGSRIEVAEEPTFTPGGPTPGGGFPIPGSQPKPVSPEQMEREANLALVEAQRQADAGDIEAAERSLNAIVSKYPSTGAARTAAEALELHRQGLPMFPEGPVVLAQQVPEALPGPAEEPLEVVAVAPGASLPEGPARVAVELPPEPPEPFRNTGIPMERADIAPRSLPPGFRSRVEAGVHPSGWPLEITCDRDGSALVLVPGGVFPMGRDGGPADERPAHRVALPAYYIDQHETTNHQYLLFLRANGHPHDLQADDDRPVVNINASQAHAYASWAGKALPTEAQWEMAARTTDGRLHPWGDSPPDWSRPREPRQIDPVMSYPLDLSPYGAYDLAGNAWEWTADWFDPRYYEQLRDDPTIDPRGPGRGRSRTPQLAIKGGSSEWITSWRSGLKVDARVSYVGFRCVLSVEQSPPGSAPGFPQPDQAPTPAPRPTGIGPVPF